VGVIGINLHEFFAWRIPRQRETGMVHGEISNLHMLHGADNEQSSTDSLVGVILNVA
jgi:hypothetical protein